MKAITIQQPWAWAICDAGKRCENRAWSRAPGLVAQARALMGQRVAVHAGLGGTRISYAQAADRIREIRLYDDATDPRTVPRCPPFADLPRGAIVALATLAALVRTLPGGHRAMPSRIECDLCGQAIPDDGSGVCPRPDPWAIPGCYGLILDAVTVLPRPVPFRGAQGFFEVPDGAPCGER